MKHLTLILLTVLLQACMPKDLPTNVSISDQQIKVKLSHLTTRTELEQITSDLKSQNILMEYSRSQFFENGKLKSLSLQVAGENGKPAGSTVADLMGIQFHYYGFELKSNGYFKIGVLD